MRNMSHCLSAFSHGFRLAHRLLDKAVTTTFQTVATLRLSSRLWSTKIVDVSNQDMKISRPSSVVVVAGLVLLEALAVLAYTVNYAINIPNEGSLNLGAHLFMLALCLFLAVWQGTVAFSFYKGKAFTRAPIIVWQLFQLILSVSFLKSDIAMVIVSAIISIIVAGAIVVFLFAPKTTQFLGDRPQR